MTRSHNGSVQLIEKPYEDEEEESTAAETAFSM